MTAVAAVDLGASAGRVLIGVSTSDGLTLREIHRFANDPVRVRGVLRWDVLGLFHGIVEGLRRAEAEVGQLDAVGVDGWGVDYGLLDGDGQLLGNPAHYRDARTAPVVREVLDTVGAEALYEATGTQLQPFNTVFQLLTDRRSAAFAAARQVMLVPDLMSFWLGGEAGTELTNASTTGLLDPRTMDWTTALDAPVELFAPLRRPGHVAGKVLPELGLDSAPVVVTVGSHDTASAVAGVPASSERYAYVCTGTWALVGVDRPAPVITEAARAANFTNEVGVEGSVRFLRNVTGFWLLQECVRQWRAEGVSVDAAELTRAAAQLPPLTAVIDVQEPGFAAPGDMVTRVVEGARRTCGVALTTPAQITRCILDSMALAVRHAVRAAVALSGSTVDVVHVVGGGAVNAPFCQAVADACQLPVVAGPTEAAAWGNALVQARTLGAINSLADARAAIARAEPTTTYQVRGDEEPWQRADAIIGR
jgi:rhamnulokinase